MNRQAVQTLKTYFGYDTFREGQEAVIDALLAGKDVLAVMPTGAGMCLQSCRQELENPSVIRYRH